MKRIILTVLIITATLFVLLGQEFVGIGVVLKPYSSQFCDYYYEITEVIKGGPADKAGMRPYTCVYEVDGIDLKGESVTNVINKILGEEGTKVTLTTSYNRQERIEMVRERITPEMINNTPKLSEQEQEKLRAKRQSEIIAKEWERFNKGFFDLVVLATQSANDQFETFLNKVDYQPCHDDYRGATGHYRNYPVKAEFLNDLGLYNMNQRFSLGFSAQHPYAFGGSFFPLRKGYSFSTSDEYFDKMHSDFKKLINEKYSSKGWILKEYKTDPEKDIRTSFFIHRPGDDKEFHKYPQIKIEFKGSSRATLNIEAPFSESDKNLMKGMIDPRRSRGKYDTDRFGYLCDCLSGNCINGASKVKCDMVGWSRREGKTIIQWDYTYTGNMKDGMAHGKGKVENVAHFEEGMFWRGDYDGSILVTNKDTRELVEHTYDKGKYIKSRSITRDAQQAALRKQWDEIMKQHKSSGGGSGSSSSRRFVYSPASRFAVPAGLPMQLEDIADGIVEVQKGNGYRLVQRYSSKMSSTHTFYTTKYGYRVDIIAITGGNLGKAELEVRNLSAKKYRTARYPEYFDATMYRSDGTGVSYFKAFTILDNAPGGERAELHASTWNYTDGYVILMVFEKREF